jgi:hypothetical protein
MAKILTVKALSPEVEAILARYATEIKTLEGRGVAMRSEAKRNALMIGQHLWGMANS